MKHSEFAFYSSFSYRYNKVTMSKFNSIYGKTDSLILYIRIFFILKITDLLSIKEELHKMI